ncbi:helix-turn-helix domain-containing protein [Paracoccus subflavus]|nr:helix-turn-helix transcriptional regulator [Paracoccus subflavus]
MSTQISTDSVAARLRALRGDESQEAFSRRVGITRSALANYETGRTKPKPAVLRQICQKLGISEALLPQGRLSNLGDLVAALGIHEEGGTLPGLTEDEKAIIRILRLCSTPVVNRVVTAMISGVEAQDFDRRLADPATAPTDVARLYQIAKNDGAYERGVTPDALAAIVDVLSKQRESKKLPQSLPQ